MIGILEYPKNPHAKGRITPYLKRLGIKTRQITIIDGSEEALREFVKIAKRNGGKIVVDIRILTPNK